MTQAKSPPEPGPKRETLAWNMLLLAKTREVVDALSGAGVDALVVKGAAVLEVAGGLQTRWMSDADLLIPRHCALAAHRVMLDTGFAWWQPPGRDLTARWHYERAYRAPRGELVELHTYLAHRLRWAVDYPGLFARSVEFSLAGAPGRRLSNEDMVLHAAINAAKDDFEAVDRAAQDIAALQHAVDIEWDVVVRRAHQWRASAALWFVALHAMATTTDAIPEWVPRALRPARIRRAYLLRTLDPARMPPYRSPRHASWLQKLLVSAGSTDDVWRFATTVAQLGALRVFDRLRARR